MSFHSVTATERLYGPLSHRSTRRQSAIAEIAHTGYNARMMTNRDGPSGWDVTALTALQGSLPTKVLGHRIHFVETAESTNDLARQLARGGEVDGTVVIAERQTAGRGRQGRAWHSPQGGLWMSLLLAPEGWPLDPSLLTLLSSVAFARGVEATTGVTVGLKWPNDLRLGQRKVAGILGELQPVAVGSALILGAGFNVNIKAQDFPFQLRSTSVSMCEADGRTVDLVQLLEQLLLHLDQCYVDFLAGVTQPWIDQYRSRCVSLGATVTVRTMVGDVSGRAEDINSSGALLLRTAAGELKTLLAGDLL